VEDLQGKYVAFNANYLKAIQYTTALQEAISIAKRPDLWPKLSDFFANPSYSRYIQLSKDPDFKPLVDKIPIKYQLLFMSV
jgi:hypothetical protein